MNPFLRRATEYLRDTAPFLQLTRPEPLNTFIASHNRRLKAADVIDVAGPVHPNIEAKADDAITYKPDHLMEVG